VRGSAVAAEQKHEDRVDLVLESGGVKSGREAAETFLVTWDFAAYVAEFRSGKTHSRRDDLTAELQRARSPLGV
jgi:hypothetical protein